jgi:Fe-S oxidoreductase
MSREGSLEAPTRHPIDWQNPDFYDEDKLNEELERVYDICHGCRRCVSLCNAFPTLFDLVDESETMEVDGVDKADYGKVVEHCYLCDLCFMTKCPYVPPHEWNVDFPHLMLRAKAVQFKKQAPPMRDRLLANTDLVGKLAGIPVVADVVNAANRNSTLRGQMDKLVGIHRDAPLPEFHSKPYRSRHADKPIEAQPAGETTGKVALFATCYGNRNAPQINEALTAVMQHNGISVQLLEKEQCCGMPKLELGDLESVMDAWRANKPALLAAIDAGCDIVAPIPSCVLMFKQELPLMLPDDADLKRVQAAIYDPFEYLMLRHKAGALKTDFPQSLGKVAYHAACHLRVQNMGLKTRDLLALVPGTEIEVIERCSGHDGTYAVKSEYRDASVKICRPVVSRVQKSGCDHYASDCPMAGEQIASIAGDDVGPGAAEHPLILLRHAYGI